MIPIILITTEFLGTTVVRSSDYGEGEMEGEEGEERRDLWKSFYLTCCIRGIDDKPDDSDYPRRLRPLPGSRCVLLRCVCLPQCFL